MHRLKRNGLSCYFLYVILRIYLDAVTVYSANLNISLLVISNKHLFCGMVLARF